MADTQIVLDKTGPGNYLKYSEQFDNAAWVKHFASITANAALAPDGTNSADKLVENTQTSSHYIDQAVSGLDARKTYTYSISLKAAGRDFAGLQLGSAGYASFATVIVDLLTGTITATYVNGTAASPSVVVTPSGSSWFRVSVTTVPETANISGLMVNVFPQVNGAIGGLVYEGNGVDGIYVWGAQISEGGPDAYAPTTSTAPVPRVWRVPDDWNNAHNTIHVVGAGGRTKGVGVGGAGGGAYAGDENLSLTAGALVSYQNGDGSADTDSYNSAKDSWFVSSSTLKAQGGQGQSSGSGVPRVAGGLAANSIGSVKNDGGKGGAGVISPTRGGFGAGAGGPHGHGLDGSDGDGVATGGSTATDGYSGASDDGFDAGGVTYNAAANPGTQWDGIGPGSGGAPGQAGSGIAGSAGGLYGGGASGPTIGDSSTYIAGGNGVIVITWSTGPQVYSQNVMAVAVGVSLASRATTRSLSARSTPAAIVVLHRLFATALRTAAHPSVRLARRGGKRILATASPHSSLVRQVEKLVVGLLTPVAVATRIHFATLMLRGAATPLAGVLLTSTRKVLAHALTNNLIRLGVTKPLFTAASPQSTLVRSIIAVHIATSTGTSSIRRAIAFSITRAATASPLIENLTTRSVLAVASTTAAITRLTMHLLRGVTAVEAILSRSTNKQVPGAAAARASIIWRLFPIAAVGTSRTLIVAWQDRLVALARQMRTIVIPAPRRTSELPRQDREKKE